MGWDWVQHFADMGRRASGRRAPGGPGGPPRRPPAARGGADAYWIPSGQQVTVAGHRIAGGMVYVGRGLRSVARRGLAEPALIDPVLPVGSRSDTAGVGVGTSPSYSSIPPDGRAAYLDWLEGGRVDPGVAITYVLLFFYGLERRLLADGCQSDAAQAEAPVLIAEVERLAALYGGNWAFGPHARACLEMARVLAARRGAPMPQPPFPSGFYELPAPLRYGLARLAAEGRPASWAWALAWYSASRFGSLRTPATRCKEEFHCLFRLRYAGRFGEGLRLSPTGTRLAIRHHTASPSFGGEVVFTMGDLADVSQQEVPLREIGQIAEGTQDELDAYSRWLGRHPKDRGSLVAVSLLPEDLLTHMGCDAIDALRHSLDGLLEGVPRTVVRGEVLLNRWPRSDTSRFGKRDAVGLAQALGKCGYGMEPDVRFGGATPKPDDPLVLFRLPKGSPAAPTESYLAAMFVLRLFIAVALADGKVSDAEHEELVAHLKARSRLTSPERERLRAYVRWLVRTRPGLAGLKRHADALTPQQRHALGSLLIAVAGADGAIAAPEVTALAKVYPLIGLDPDDVHSDIHALAAGAPSEPVTVCAPEPTTSRFAIPAPPTVAEPEPGAVTLDMERVRATLAESGHVASLLGSIFVEEEETTCAVAEGEASLPCVAGLDAAHSALLHRLEGQAALDRASFEELAAECCVLPDGALDALNDAALEAGPEPLCEGDDPIEVNQTVLREMLV